MANIKRVATDMCMMDYWPDSDKVREEYGNEAADNNIVWNFKQRLGEDVEILSISVVYIASWETIDFGRRNRINSKRQTCNYMTDKEKDICQTCEHFWLDFPMPLDHAEAHCDVLDGKVGLKGLDEEVAFPCLECPFDSYSEKK